jgi:hypothetical protein
MASIFRLGGTLARAWYCLPGKDLRLGVIYPVSDENKAIGSMVSDHPKYTYVALITFGDRIHLRTGAVIFPNRTAVARSGILSVPAGGDRR